MPTRTPIDLIRLQPLLGGRVTGQLPDLPNEAPAFPAERIVPTRHRGILGIPTGVRLTSFRGNPG